MKAVMASIRPTWCEDIFLKQRKLTEIRKSTPKLEQPFKVYVYCTRDTGGHNFNVPITPEHLLADVAVNGMKCMNCESGNGKVIGEFICDWVLNIPPIPGTTVYNIAIQELARACLSAEQLRKYGRGAMLYGWGISRPKLYARPRALADFGLARPPQSWQYVEEAEIRE